jgi:hypothetical protein
LQKLREFGNAVSVVKDTESEEAFYYLDAAYYNDETGLLDEKQNPFLME